MCLTKIMREALASCGLPENVRGERLSLADYAALADALARETEA